MDLDDTICYCFHISKRKIVNFVRVHQPRRASQISECGGAGTGCGWCVPFLKKMFDAANSELEVAIPETAEQYAADRAAYVRSGKGNPPASAEPIPSTASSEPS